METETIKNIHEALEKTMLCFKSKDIYYIQTCLKNIKLNINLITTILEKTIQNYDNYKNKEE